ncbi:MAG: hypothetical protein ACOC3C_04285 [Candidatus Thorarchaeota archaeon]
MGNQINRLGEILAILGGLLGLLYGILDVLGWGFGILPGLDLGLGGTLGPIIMGIIVIIISLVILATSGVVNIPMLKMGQNWIIMIVLGILLYVFGAGLPGILVIIGAILMLL